PTVLASVVAEGVARTAGDDDFVTGPQRGRFRTEERRRCEGLPGVPRRAVRGRAPTGDNDVLLSGPDAEGMLAAGEGRPREAAPGVRGRVVCDTVRERVAAAAAAPAEQLLARPHDGAEPVVHAQQLRVR